MYSEPAKGVSTISVGNLSFGGTGKTPMTQWLIQVLATDFQIAVLSRGYGRTTKGFREVKPDENYRLVGDEPLLIKQKFPHIPVVVCEDRLEGIRQIKKIFPSVKLILLDDALQHRRLRPDVSILLTTWNKPYFNDSLFPAGTLRDLKERANSVDITVITKTPDNATEHEKAAIMTAHKKHSDSPVFFCYYKNKLIAELSPEKSKAVIVSTVADPEQLIHSVLSLGFSVEKVYKFRDHHPITMSQWENIFETCRATGSICIISQKERVKMPKELFDIYKNLIGILDIDFVLENNDAFKNLIIKKLRT